MIASNSYGALSATSANTIKGNAPWFKSNSGENKLGFKVNGVEYSQGLGNIDSSVPKEFDGNLTLNDFTIKTLRVTDFKVSTDYFDNDGDIAHPNTPFTMDAMRYEWKDGADNIISSADMNKMIGCGGGFSLPLKLIITIPNVQVHSKYGIPKDSGLTDLTKEYKITAPLGICFAKPNDMIYDPTRTWYNPNARNWNRGSSARDPVKGGGYNSDDFDPVNGFKVTGQTKFPTTGFPGAKFQLLMVGSQTDYTYSSSTGSAVVDVNGFVTLISKPYGNITIRATSKLNPTIYFDYTFSPRNPWAVPVVGNGDASWGSRQCANLRMQVLSRSELTNSPQKTAVCDGNSLINSAFTRAIGQGVLGEWGNLFMRYPDSLWDGYTYRTGDSCPVYGQYTVDIDNGSVGYWYSHQGYPIACR
ncbi:hypothetical protein RCS94_09155 [Orbaceae bacterium ac157xtp]